MYAKCECCFHFESVEERAVAVVVAVAAAVVHHRRDVDRTNVELLDALGIQRREKKIHACRLKCAAVGRQVNKFFSQRVSYSEKKLRVALQFRCLSLVITNGTKWV